MGKVSGVPLSGGVTDVARRIRDRYESGGVAEVATSSYHFLRARALQRYYTLTHTARTDADPYKILRLDPDDIEYVSGLGLERRGTGRHLQYVRRPWYFRCAEHGDVLGGDWDSAGVKFTELAEWTLIEERFGEGIPWRETSVYEDLVASVERGHRMYGCSTVAELHERFRYLTAVKESIASDGYRRVDGDAPDGVGVGHDGAAALDEVTIDIGRDGELLHHTNGRHRLALAKVLDVPEIPVLVKLRHEGWQRTRDRIRAGVRLDRSHPDLLDIAGSRGARETVELASGRG